MRPLPDRAKFDALVEQIYAGLDRPLTAAKREAIWHGCKALSLVELGRVRDLLFQEAASGAETPRALGVGQLWAAHRRLRARAPVQAEETGPQWTGDAWDIRANFRLLAHIAHAAAQGRHYASRREAAAYPRGTDWKADAQTQALTGALVEAKRAWAQAMRDWSGQPTPSDMAEVWATAIDRADAQCKALR